MCCRLLNPLFQSLPFFAIHFGMISSTFRTVALVRTLLAGRKIRCACLGAVFNLPMSYVTLAEDALMAAKAAVMLVGGHA
jgi:hypothetical protein